MEKTNNISQQESQKDPNTIANNFDAALFITAMEKLTINLEKIHAYLSDNKSDVDFTTLQENGNNLTLYFQWQQPNFEKYIQSSENSHIDSQEHQDFIIKAKELCDRIQELSRKNEKMLEKRLHFTDNFVEFMKKTLEKDQNTYIKYVKDGSKTALNKRTEASAILFNKKA